MELAAKYQSVILSTDYMFVNSILFFKTYSRDIRFITSRQQDLKTGLTKQAMKSMNAYYVMRGFKIVELRADQKFEPAQAALSGMQIEMDGYVRDEHIPEIECLNKTIKERIWYVYTELILVYVRVPRVLVRKLVYAITFWPNSFPVKYGISATMRPQAIITGQSIEFNNH